VVVEVVIAPSGSGLSGGSGGGSGRCATSPGTVGAGNTSIKVFLVVLQQVHQKVLLEEVVVLEQAVGGTDAIGGGGAWTCSN
jgi:hypothetical protein